MDVKKRKIDESHYKQLNHFDILASMWNQGDFCDVTIQVGAETYPVHKIILIAFIPYFRNMFSHAFLEKNKDTIPVTGVNPQSMKIIIQFAYTGIISWEDVHDLSSLIKDADFLGLENVKNEAIKFLERNCNYKAAIEMYHLSTLICSSSLKKWSRKFIQSNFETISRTDEFLELNFTTIKDMLSEESSKFYINEIFKGVLRWIEHDIADRYSNLKELCSLIRIGNADFHDILEIVNDAYYWSKLLRQCTSLNSEIELYYKKSKDNIEPNVNVINYLRGIVTCSELSSTKLMMYRVMHNTALGEWNKISGTKELRCFFRIAVSNSHLFIIGGEQYSINQTAAKNESLNLKNIFNSWKQMSPLGTSRKWFGIVTVLKYIFVCGGKNQEHVALNSVEKYSVETDSWTYVAPMNVKRHSFSIAAVDNYLYAIGGMDNSNEMIGVVERYDLTRDCWENLSSRLNTARRDFGVAVLNKKIYVCGGVTGNGDDFDNLSSVEVYDPSTNNWQYVARMPEDRHSLFVVSHAGKLWAIGGSNDEENLSDVIEYDPETDKWSYVKMEMDAEMESIKGRIVGCTI